tara:strand:+ start:384 stop:563 length:180 start_codon:yes stop_codon:yes gene_type:complete
MTINFIVYWFSGDNLAELMMDLTYQTVKPIAVVFTAGLIAKENIASLNNKWKTTQLATS